MRREYGLGALLTDQCHHLVNRRRRKGRGPGSGATKIELLRYYGLVGPLMMLHLKGRPVSLVRAPEGVGGPLFFQKHAEAQTLPGIRQLDPALYISHPPMLEVASARGLLSAAQWNVIEFHTLNTGTRSFEHPDRMVFDLDPGEGVAWKQVQEAAELVHAFLGQLGLVSFLKTSGGKGLHVVVPLRKVHDWDTVKGFSQAVVVHMAQTLPKRFVAKSGPRNRVGKIFIDYLRNGLGATTVCAWSARARPGLGVSVPIEWRELTALRSADQWTIRNVHERLDVGNTPWSGYAKAAKSLDLGDEAAGLAARRRLRPAGFDAASGALARWLLRRGFFHRCRAGRGGAGLALGQALREQFGQVDHVRRARCPARRLRARSPFRCRPASSFLLTSACTAALKRVGVRFRLPRRRHVADQLRRHLQFAGVQLRGRLAGGWQLQLVGRAHLAGPADRVQHQRRARRDQRGQVFLGVHHDPRDADHAGIEHRFAQQRIDLLALAGRLQEVGPVEQHEGDLAGLHEGFDLDRLRRLRVGRLDLLVAQHDVVAIVLLDVAVKGILRQGGREGVH